MRILPFRGIFYNTDKVDIKDITTLPYDKIHSIQKTVYESRNPYNMVHLILPKTHNEASSLFTKWQKDGILQKDLKPAVYVYEQEYEYPAGITNTRRGFIVLLELQSFSKDTVMPHERTFSKVVKDRSSLLASCKTNLEQIFILYSGVNLDNLVPENLRVNFKDEFGITHRLWPIEDEGSIKGIQESMKNAKLFIADGHHRYEAALLHKETQKESLGNKYNGREGFNYRMATFVDVASKGLTILPTHRVLKEVPNLDNRRFIAELEKYFIVKKDFSGVSKKPHTFGVYLGEDNYYTLILKDNISLDKLLNISRPRPWLYLDVNILHLLILKHIMGIDTHNASEELNVLFLREKDEAVNMVRNKMARVAFILNPTRIEEVKEIVSLSEVMPHKSTDFYPKLLSGLVMRSLE